MTSHAWFSSEPFDVFMPYVAKPAAFIAYCDQCCGPGAMSVRYLCARGSLDCSSFITALAFASVVASAAAYISVLSSSEILIPFARIFMKTWNMQNRCHAFGNTDWIAFWRPTSSQAPNGHFPCWSKSRHQARAPIVYATCLGEPDRAIFATPS